MILPIKKLDVLIACENSGQTRREFESEGHNTYSCDILPADDGEERMHIKDKLENVLAQRGWWDLIIAHPPCTYLCNSGVRWLHERPERWELMRQGAAFFNMCLSAPAHCIAVENPVMHKYAKEIIGRGHDFTVQPWQFGDPAKKRTCFWTKGLSPLKPTSDMTAKDAVAECHLASPGKDRWKIRSKTYPGIAKAMATQWGCEVQDILQNGLVQKEMEV